jgi:hypothetical protein
MRRLTIYRPKRLNFKFYGHFNREIIPSSVVLLIFEDYLLLVVTPPIHEVLFPLNRTLVWAKNATERPNYIDALWSIKKDV